MISKGMSVSHVSTHPGPLERVITFPTAPSPTTTPTSRQLSPRGGKCIQPTLYTLHLLVHIATPIAVLMMSREFANSPIPERNRHAGVPRVWERVEV